MTRTTRFVSLKRHVPTGRVDADDFTVEQKDVPDPEEGQLLLRPVAFSIDPTTRGQLTGVEGSYFLPQLSVGGPVTGIAVAEVVESRNDRHQPGELVVGLAEWADYSIWPAPGNWMNLESVDPRFGTPSHALGVFGVRGGLTAYCGIVEAAHVVAGETVVISAAAGNVGLLAGQIARIRGARVIGLASSPPKRAVLTERLGFDAALDYRAPDLAEQITTLFPGGPDVYFDNVGGEVSQVVMGTMRRPARVVVSGQISTYDDESAWMVNIKPICINGLRFEGFTPVQFQDAWPGALDHLVDWVQSGQLIQLETERHGLEALPGAVAGIFRGENIGKMVVTIP
jgi:NADPH-dependent curcumin reductase CurA